MGAPRWAAAVLQAGGSAGAAGALPFGGATWLQPCGRQGSEGNTKRALPLGACREGDGVGPDSLHLAVATCEAVLLSFQISGAFGGSSPKAFLQGEWRLLGPPGR